MGDRLTLETADERKAWLDIMAETCSTREADAAIRAYRVRLPKVHTLIGDLEPRVAARIGDAMGGLIDADREERESDGAPRNIAWKRWAQESDDVPRDYTVPREQLARLVHFILTPDSEQRAYCLDPVGTIASVDAAIAEVERLRGPTEGASDAAFMASAGAIHEAVSWLLALGADSTQLNAAAIEKLAAHTVREYAVERAGEIGQWAAHDDSAKLGTLIGAVEDATGLLRDWVGVIGDRDPGVTAALTAIAGRLDAAKGDAPTECECGPGARFDEDAQVCQECRRPLHDAPSATPSPTTQDPRPTAPDGLESRISAAIRQERGPRIPAPQVPDSPGSNVMTPPTPNVPTSPGWAEVWLDEDWRDVWVSLGDPDETGGRGLYWLNTKTDETDGVDGHFWRGGRCTRGAPDVDVEALRRLADSLDGPGTHSDAHAIRTALGDA